MKFLWIFFAVLIHGCACPGLAWTQASSKVVQVDQASGVSSTPNYWKTGDAEFGLAGVSTYNDGDVAKPVDCTGGTADRLSVAKVSPALYDKQSWYITKTAFAARGQGVAFEFDVDNGIAAREYMEVLFDYLTGDGVFAAGSSTTNSDLMVYIYDVTAGKLIEPFGNNGSKLVKSSTTEKGAYQANFYSTIGSTKYRVCLHQATTNAVYYRLKVDAGKIQKGALFSGTPPNTFTALVSTTGVVTRETPEDWLNGNCTPSSGDFNCPYVPGKFTAGMNCTGSLQDSISSDQTLNRITSDSVGIQVQTKTGAGTSTAVGFTVSCTKTGSDYIQPAITPNQWNFGTRNTTPTWTNLGFTPGTNVISYSRSGDRLIAKGILEYSSGTGSVSALTLTLPEGLSIDTVKLGNTSALQHFGSWFWYDDAGSTSTLDDTFGAVTYFSANSVRFYVPNDLSMFRTNLMSTNDRFSFNFSVPIVGWTENQGAPQLVGSVIGDTTIRAEKSAGVTTVDYGTTSVAVTNVSNATSITSPANCTYMRVGDVVNASCNLQTGCTTAAGTLTQLSIVPPVATTNGATIQGTIGSGVDGETGRVIATGNNVLAQFFCRATGAGGKTLHFTYKTQ